MPPSEMNCIMLTSLRMMEPKSPTPVKLIAMTSMPRETFAGKIVRVELVPQERT